MEKILGSEIVFEGRAFAVQRDKIVNKEGAVSLYDTVRHPGAVVIIPVLDDGRYVMVRQYRRSVRATLLEFPAGTLERGEEPIVCARRELAEETNFQAAEWKSLGLLLPTPGFCNEVQHGFLARGLTPCGGKLDADEFIEVVKLSPQELHKLVASGELTDSKSLALFTRATASGALPGAW